MGKNSNQQKDDVMTVKLRKLESAVRDLRVNFNETNIHGFVNCILKGWIIDGRFTDEYRQLIIEAQAEEARLRQEEIDREQAMIEKERAAEESARQDNSQAPSIVIDTSKFSIR